MENFAQLIANLLEHSQRFFDILNLQLVIVLGVLVFSLTNQEIISKLHVHLLLSAVFIAIALFSVFSSRRIRTARKNYGLLLKRVSPWRQVNLSLKKSLILIL